MDAYKIIVLVSAVDLFVTSNLALLAYKTGVILANALKEFCFLNSGGFCLKTLTASTVLF